MGDFKTLKSEHKPVLNTCNNNGNSSSGDYPESVILEYFCQTKPGLPVGLHESVVLESSVKACLGCPTGKGIV